MKIVLLEGLGVSEAVMKEHVEKLVEMGHEFIQYDRNPNKDVQAERCRDADAVILANMLLAREAVSSAEKLKFIDVAFTGVDHIPMDAARAKGIAVSNASGYATEAVAELCISFMIQLLRNTAKVEERCRTGGTKDGLVGNLLAGKTVGIVGAGLIGKRVAALAKAFGCRTIAYNRSEVKDAAIDRQVSLEELLKESDIVSLHCPLTDETKGLIGKEQLALMKETAFVLHTARGGVLDSLALADALKKGEFAGAAIDVFENEPPLDTAHPLLNCPNTIVTPHIGFASAESLEQRADIVFENLYSWLRGKQINAVK